MQYNTLKLQSLYHKAVFLVKRVPGWGLEQREYIKIVLYLLIIFIIILISYIIIYYYILLLNY